MAYDFLGLVNDLNSRLNEVKLTTSNFANAVGWYDDAKTSVNSAIRHVLQHTNEWPFIHTEKTQYLTPGVNEYDLPTDLLTADIDSFRIKKNTTLLVNRTEPLDLMTYQRYSRDYRQYEDVDTVAVSVGTPLVMGGSQTGTTLIMDGLTSAPSIKDAFTIAGLSNTYIISAVTDDTGGQYTVTITEALESTPDDDAVITFLPYSVDDKAGVPAKVAFTQNNKFILVPNPNRAYKLIYEYHASPDDLSAHNDTTVIPEKFRYIIRDGSAYYGYLFRENIDASRMAWRSFEKGLQNMEQILVNKHRLEARPV